MTPPRGSPAEEDHTKNCRKGNQTVAKCCLNIHHTQTMRVRRQQSGKFEFRQQKVAHTPRTRDRGCAVDSFFFLPSRCRKKKKKCGSTTRINRRLLHCQTSLGLAHGCVNSRPRTLPKHRESPASRGSAARGARNSTAMPRTKFLANV